MATLQFVLLIAFGLFLSGGPSAAQPEPAHEPECRHRLEDTLTWTKQERSAWNKRLCIGENKVDFADFPESTTCEETVLSSAFIRRLLTYRPMRDVLDRYSTSSIELKCASLNEQLDLRKVQSDKEIVFDDFLFREGIDVGGSSLRHVSIINSEVHGDFFGAGVETDGDITLQNSVLHANLILSRAKISGAMSINDSRIHGRIDLNYSNVHEGVIVYKCSLGDGENTESDEVALDIVEARIFADVQLYGCNIQGMVRGHYVHIDGRLRMINSDINGDLDFSHANVGTVDVDSLKLGNGHPDPICKFRGIKLGYAKIAGDLKLGSLGSTACEIGGDVDSYRAHIGGEWHLLMSEIQGNVNMKSVNVGDDVFMVSVVIEEIIDAQRLVVDGSIIVRDSNVGHIVGPRMKVASDIEVKNTEWKEMDLTGANVEGDLFLDNCSDEQGRRKLVLRNANVSGIRECERECVCVWESIDGDFFGWKYDSVAMKEILERDVEWLGEWIAPKQGGSSETLEEAERHIPHLYVYLAERLNDLGMTKEATKIRILERERNLLQLKGWEWVWQWIVGQTTRFGYRPGRTLLSFAGLIVVGTVILMLANCIKGRTWFNKPMGPLLYSMDRAVPFLGFASGHVRWSEETQRLNDMPLVCLYFYLHSILGFALISIFIAGLTGVLK